MATAGWEVMFPWDTLASDTGCQEQLGKGWQQLLLP